MAKGITFFSEVDCNKEGGIKSDMPAWYLERHIEYLEEDIFRKERLLKSGSIADEQVARMKEEVTTERSKLNDIQQGRPNLTAAQRDQCAREYESLGKQIQSSMPTRKQTRDGLVNPYEEMKRMKNKHIDIDPTLAKQLGVHPQHGKISGDEANKCFQILGSALGESTNVERLRRDGRGEAYQTIHDLTQAILKGDKIKGV